MSAGLLELGLNGALHIREEHLSMRPDACRLMYVGDIHLRRRRSNHLCRQVIETARRSKADAVLLGGDMVDSPSELNKLRDLVGALCELAPVLAVGGTTTPMSVSIESARRWSVAGVNGFMITSLL